MSAPDKNALPDRVRPFSKTQTDKRWLHWIVGRNPAPTENEWRQMAQALWDGDEPMDQLVDWMLAEKAPDRRQLFERALTNGIESLDLAAGPLQEFFAIIDKEPAWLDRNLLEEGVRFIHGTGLAAPYVLRDFALMGGYLLSGFNQALILTGALNKSASQRIAETGRWWIDCTESLGLSRFGMGFKSTIRVRWVHALVRRNLKKNPQWDSARWGAPLSQIDMVATYLAFGPVMLGGLRVLGIPVTPRESRAVMHLWKYAGWLMGVEERWLVDDERQGILRLYHTFMTQSRPDESSRLLGRALSQEPLSRTYARFETWHRQLAYHQHLSVSRLFLGKKGLEDLGLPRHIHAWFPVLTVIPRLAAYCTGRFLLNPERLQQQGRKLQLEALASMFGEKSQQIMSADPHLSLARERI